MVWVRLDDRFPEDPAVVNLSDAAFRVYVTALCYCGRNETDGAFSFKAIPGFTKPAKDELFASGLWQPAGVGQASVRNFLKYNPGKELLGARRQEAAERMRRVRANKGRTSQEPDSTPAPAPAPAPAPNPEPVPVPGKESVPRRNTHVRAPRREPSPEAVRVAEYLRDAIIEHSPDHACGLNGAHEKWAVELDRAIRRDKRSSEDLCAAVDFAHRRRDQPFWRPNIQSGKKLRAKFDILKSQAARESNSLRANPATVGAIQRWAAR